MSTAINLNFAGKKYRALPPSFAFQKANKEKMQQLMAGQMPIEESQEFMAEYVKHCIRRAMPDVDMSELEEHLDAINIAAASQQIGNETQRQIAKIYGVDNLGESQAGKA